MGKKLDSNALFLCVYQRLQQQLERAGREKTCCDDSVNTHETVASVSSSAEEDNAVRSESLSSDIGSNMSNDGSTKCRRSEEMDTTTSANNLRKTHRAITATSRSPILFIRKVFIETGKAPSNHRAFQNKVHNDTFLQPRRMPLSITFRPPDASDGTTMRNPTSKRLQRIRASMIEKEFQLRQMIKETNENKDVVKSEKLTFDLTTCIDDNILLEGVRCETQNAEIIVQSRRSKLYEMRETSKQQREKIQAMLGNAVTKVTTEPVQCKERETGNMDVISSIVSGDKSEEGGKCDDQCLLELRDRLTELEISRAWGELQLRNRIAKDAQEYGKTIKSWKKEATDWKNRFESFFSASQCQRKESGTVSADSTILVDAKSDLERSNASTPYSTGIDQANLLQDAMETMNKIGWKIGVGMMKAKEPSADEILLERLRIENEILRGEISNLQS